MGLAEHHDGVQGPVQLPVPTTIEAMTDDLARGGLDRGRAGQHGKGGLGSESARLGPADQQLGGVDRADAGLGQQSRGHGHDELAQFGLELVGVLTGGQDPLGGHAEREGCAKSDVACELPVRADRGSVG